MKKNSIYQLIKNKRYLLFIFFLFILNAVFLHYNLSELKEKKLSIKAPFPEVGKFNQGSENHYFLFNSLAPDFTSTTFDGKTITLSNWKEQVIILQFSKFYLSELPYLLYLEYINKKYQSDVHLIFINRLGKQKFNAINNVINLTSPIIEDDGFLSNLFNIRGDETIIIGKDFNIKYKNLYSDKRIINNLVLRYIDKNPQTSTCSLEELTNLIKKISFINLETGKTVNLKEMMKDKNILIHLSISPCMTCPENRRVHLLKNISLKITPEKSQIVFLFGIGNRIESLTNYIFQMELNKYPIIAGLIEEGERLKEAEYLKLFQLDTDPRMIIIDKSRKTIFSEKFGDSRRTINENFLLKLL